VSAGPIRAGLALVCALLACACGRSTEPANSQDPAAAAVPKTPDGRPLGQVALPDLSQMAPSAQTQIRERFAVLTRTIDNRSASVVDLSTAYGEMGKLLMAAQYADVAEACFLNAQTLDPSDFRWPYYLAHIYRSAGEVDKSRALFERALQLRPDDVAALMWLGDTYLAAGQPDAAEPQFAKALSLEPTSVSARYGLGRVALAKSDPARAVKYLEEVLAVDPDAAGAHYPLSLAYAALGEEAKAAEHLRQRRSREILPADPLMVEIEHLLESPKTYETLGIRALEREDWQAAAAEFRKGLALEPESPALRHRLATAMNMMGDKPGAEALFEEVVRDAPDYFPAQFSLGVIMQAKGRHEEAIERFTAALAQRGDYAEARLRLASSLRHVGRVKESLANYEQVARLNPDLLEAQVGYAMTLAVAGRYGDARDRLSAGMAAHPDQPVFAHGLARVLAAAPDDKVRDGQRAMTLVQALLPKGRTLELGETMAMTLAELGQFDEAASVQRDVIRSAERAGVPGTTARLERNLALYEQRQPCRTPWTGDELP
jgi:tetratricopeptide (TPR) repeat protein